RRRDLVGQADQPVGGLPHGGEDDDDSVAGLRRLDDAPGYTADLLRVGDGRSAVLLDDQRHGVGHATARSGGVQAWSPPGWARAPGRQSGGGYPRARAGLTQDRRG